MSKCVVGGCCWLMLAALTLWPLRAGAAVEQTFDVLQIGTRTYKNVTVTTKAKDYVFILHSAGMASFKTKELPPEVLTQLGYDLKADTEEKAKSSWMKKANTQLAKFHLPHLQALEQEVQGLKDRHSVLSAVFARQRLWLLLGLSSLLYLFYCYSCGLLCQKAGQPAGPLIWLPLLKQLPLLRAAGMSGWWILASLVPIVNLLGHVIWSVKIVQARDKSEWLAVPMVLPVTNVLTLLYLAYSGAAEPEEKPVVEIMTLDAA